MRAVIQRVKRASVRVNGEELAKIGRGFLVFVGFVSSDTEEVMTWMARKISSLRVFEDEGGKMNLGLDAVGGGILVVSQFTLYGDCTKGKRPSFARGASPDAAEALYDRFIEVMQVESGSEVASGVFQAHMEIESVNDGPVTLLVEKEAR
jgi:D-tyrosyl-tRNA(Tyr) deacylase